MPLCAIHQPQFLPWLGYLDKIRRVDRFVFLDDVQFKKNEYQNRNRVLVFGRPGWLTVPVRFSFGDSLRQVRIAEAATWPKKMWQTLVYNYSATPFFDAYAEGLRNLLFSPWSGLAELNAATVRWLMRSFGIATAVSVSSAMPGLSDEPTGRLLDICARVGCDAYLSGAGGRNYLDPAAFAARDVNLVFQDYRPASYPQRSNGAPGAFVPYLSAVDALFNLGGEAAAALTGAAGPNGR